MIKNKIAIISAWSEATFPQNSDLLLSVQICGLLKHVL